MRRRTLVTLAGLVLLSACSSQPSAVSVAPTPADPMSGMPMPSYSATPTAAASTTPGADLPGMPALLDPNDLYAADRPGMLAAAVAHDPPRIYVPNQGGDSVTVIDPATYKVLTTVRVGHSPEHVVPSWDLRTLYVNSDKGNTLTPIDPATGRFGKPIPVGDPYNLYFTPDGKYAMVMSEAAHQIVFRDAHTMRVVRTLPVSCNGVNHADFSPDGRYFLASCEFSGDVLKVDTATMTLLGQQRLPAAHPMPQDVKISPDGRTWYIADMQTNGVWILDGDAFTQPHFLPTGRGAHGLYVSRDSRYLYITNRGEGSISLLDFATQKLVAKWRIPGGGSPDMGGLSADGKVLWLSGRYDNVVYALSTKDGRLLAKIRVGANPHGLCVWPQPGRYSLGHTGILR
jgi:YVTN family beta-propeller protein